MKRFLFILFFLVLCLVCCAQNIYKGKSQYSSDIIANVKENILYEKSYKYQSCALYNYDGKYIRKGVSKYYTVVSTYIDNKLYEGTSTSIRAHFADGVFYSGSTIFYPLFNYDGKYVRRKNSKYDDDIVLTTERYVNPVFIFLILFEL